MEYWNYRRIDPLAFGNVSEIKQHSFESSRSLGETDTKIFGITLTRQDRDNPLVEGDHPTGEMQLVLRRLLKKADSEELRTLQRVLCSESQSSKWRVAFTSLIEEIQRNVDS